MNNSTLILIKRKKHFFVPALFLLFSFTSGVVASFTKQYAFDRFVSKLNNPNSHHYYNGFVSPFVKIKNLANEQGQPISRYQHLMSYFYYNSLAGCCREVVDDETSIELNNKIDVKLITQNVFQIFNKKNKFDLYTVDMNMYYSYISQEDVKDIMNNNYTVRNGCDTFIYISDTLADKLIDYYNINQLDSPYLELIKNDNYSTLNINVRDGEETITACINAVLSSSHRFGSQTKRGYGDFALVFFSSAFCKKIKSSSFDVDFKVNKFGNKKIINDIKALGYNTAEYKYEFYSFDYNKSKYTYNDSLTKQFLAVERNNFLPEYAFYIVSSFEIIIFALFSSLKSISGKYRLLCFALIFSFFVIYGIISNFVYAYPLWVVVPISCLILVAIINVKGLFVFKNDEIQNPRYYEISI